MKTAVRAAASSLAAIALALPAMAQGGPAQPRVAACENMQLVIYFAAHESDLTPQSARVIEEAGAQLRACQVMAVSVQVLSEEAHTDEESAVLSEARASSVMAALHENGIDPATYKADFSRVDAAAPGAAPMVEPMARRVTVAFEVRGAYGVS